MKPEDGEERNKKPVSCEIDFKYIGKIEEPGSIKITKPENIEPQLGELADLLRENFKDQTADEINKNFDQIMELIENACKNKK